jgi:hypothetical protein
MEEIEKNLIRRRALLERELTKAKLHLEALKLSQADYELQIITIKNAIKVLREHLRKK